MFRRCHAVHPGGRPPMMVSCPGCNNHYSIDERKLPAQGANLSCRECGTKWHVAAAAPEPPPAATPEEPLVPLRVAADPHALAAPISCPKCGHLFAPNPLGAGTTGRSPKASPSRRGLLIEDQAYFAELTKEALQGDCETTVVANVAAARDAIARTSFELVILDLSLEEGQDGTQLLTQIRQRGIPVLVFTARDETELYAGAWETLKGAGATDILIKGVNVGDEL